MNYKHHFVKGILLLAAMFTFGCEGPAGKDGADGESIIGPKGDKGDKGDQGTANVIYSSWKSVGTNEWRNVELNGATRYQLDVTAPALTQAIVDNGQVAVYIKLSQENGDVRPLPYTWTSKISNAVTLETRFDYSFTAGKIKLWGFDPINGPQFKPQDLQYRYVIIPGGQAGRVSSEIPSYEVAQQLYGIED